MDLRPYLYMVRVEVSSTVLYSAAGGFVRAKFSSEAIKLWNPDMHSNRSRN